MTVCPERDRLIDAAARDLQDDGWQAHFEVCAECAEAVGQVKAAYGALDDVLAAAPAFDPAAILDGARATASDSESGAGQAGRLVLLAAAACIAGLLIVREWERPLPGTQFVSSDEVPVEWVLEGDRDVAVLRTDNPDITVLWFFSGE